ncbi:MAG: hypothetical protein GY832_27820 [Chloroflexi bacterium]|nr:hypothetical protein [Chloroflexota bacterium]
MKKLIRLIVLSYILALIGCSTGNKNDTGFPLPPSYQGLVPGQSTKEQVIAILGEPDDISQVEAENWEYWNYYGKVIVVLSLDDKVVEWIWITERTHTLGEVIDKYGEPELILLTHPDTCSPDEYQVTNLDYPKQGVHVVLWDIPPYFRDFVVTDLMYFEPMEIEAFFECFGDMRDCSKIIEWPGFEE